MTTRNKLGFEQEFHELLTNMEQGFDSSSLEGSAI